MAQLTPDQLRTRQRVEGLIRLAAPALDLVLAVGERVSRIVEPEDVEYYPPRGARRRVRAASAQPDVTRDRPASVGGPLGHPGGDRGLRRRRCSCS